MMKKMLIMMAIAAMAFGAQATYAYTWNIDINDIDPNYQPPDNLKAWLRDDSGKTIAGISFSMFSGKEQKEGYTLYTLDTAVANSTAKGMSLDTVYTSGSLTITADPGHDGKDVYKTSVVFNTDQNLTKDYKDASHSLKIVLEGTAKDTGKYLVQEVPVTWSSDTVFAGAASYSPTPVPEPTSGLLAFLGLAGLMLKRKRAA